MRISDWSSDVCSSDLLVLIAAALPAESLALGDIVESQAGLWNVVRQPLGLPLYLVAGLGLASWGPLRQSDARDLAGGTRSEVRSEEHTSELQSLMRISYAVFCLKKKTTKEVRVDTQDVNNR